MTDPVEEARRLMEKPRRDPACPLCGEGPHRYGPDDHSPDAAVVLARRGDSRTKGENA